MNRSTPKGEATRLRIVQAAASAFVDDGYAATRMDRIVDLAGLTKGAVYFHFESKQDLALAVIENHKLRSLNVIRERVESVSPAAQQLHDLGSELIRMTRSDPHAWGVMRLAADLGTACHGSPLAEWISLVAEILRRGEADGSLSFDESPDDLAFIIVGGFDGVKSACASAASTAFAAVSGATEAVADADPQHDFERRAGLYFRSIERQLGSTIGIGSPAGETA